LLYVAVQTVDANCVEPPSGQAKIKRIGSSFKLEWTGSNIDVVVEPTLQPLIAKLQIKNTSWHRQFVQLHKAKGGALFKDFANHPYLCKGLLKKKICKQV
jgi:hypothetical protein